MNYKLCFAPILLAASLIGFAPHKHTKNPAQGQIKGHVHDQANKPLSQAILKLYDCDASIGNCAKALRVARSSSDGSFTVKANGMKPGVYTLEANLPPFYLSKAKVPIILPDDNGKSFDFVMLSDTRDAAGNLVGVSAEDAKEIYAAAKIEKNAQMEALSARIMNQAQPNAPKKEEAPQYAHAPSSSAPSRVPGVEGGTGNQQSPGSTQSSTSAAGSNADYSIGSTSTSSGAIEGCLNGSAGNWTLTDQSGKTYQLAGDTSKLSDHVGHQVRITGTDNSSSASSSGSTGSSTSSSATGAGSSSGSQPTFTVKKVKMISSPCSMSR
jgi:hypothetical protein